MSPDLARINRVLRMLGAALYFFALPLAAAAQQELVHEEHSLYRQVLVYEDAGSRCLCFTHQCAVGRQSCIDLQQPNRLVFEYTQMMLGALYLNPQPRGILIIGLGGGTLPRTLRALLPDTEIDVVEVDPAVVRVAQQYFGFHTDAHMHVFEEDGRAYVRRILRTEQRYALIMLDAYDHQYIPEHLLTQEFLTQVRSLLAPGGIVAANTFSSSRLYDSESVTYRSVFGDFYNLKSSNRVIIASNAPLPALSQVTNNSRSFAAAFQQRGFTAQSVLSRFSTATDWNPGARVLTDQYSPANLLNGATQ
jgi:spermidine synthase